MFFTFSLPTKAIPPLNDISRKNPGSREGEGREGGRKGGRKGGRRKRGREKGGREEGGGREEVWYNCTIYYYLQSPPAYHVDVVKVCVDGFEDVCLVVSTFC